MKVGVVDYGVGNLGSMARALVELRAAPTLVTRAIDLHAVDAVILPGVGNFADCARLLAAGGWVQALRDQVLGAGKPMLGVCVGMQLLASSSMEGSGAAADGGVGGLDFIPGRVEHLRALGCGLRVPHVGWNAVVVHGARTNLFDGIPDGTDFYFVHSYSFVPVDPGCILATTEYGVSVVAAIRRGHIWGAQFHPEKSSRAGFRLLRNFLSGPAC